MTIGDSGEVSEGLMVPLSKSGVGHAKGCFLVPFRADLRLERP